MKRLLSILAIGLIPGMAWAQNEVTKVDEVTVSLNSYDISRAAYPFDVPFRFVGSIPDNCVQIRFSYKLSNNEPKRSWYTLPNRLVKDKSKYVAWDDIEPSENEKYVLQYGLWKKSRQDTQFSLNCPGLHPNRKYDFRFVADYKVVLDTVQRKALRLKLAENMAVFIAAHQKDGIRNDAVRAKFNTALMKIFTDAIGVEQEKLFHYKDRKPFTIDINENPLVKASYETMDTVMTGIYGAGNVLKENADKAENAMEPIALAWQGKLDAVLSGKQSLDAGSKELLKLPMSPSIKGFSGHSYRDGLEVLQRLMRAPKQLKEVVLGKLKLSNKELVASEGTDLPTFQFLHSLFALFEDNGLRDAKSKPIFVKSGDVGMVLRVLLQGIQQHERIVLRKAELQRLKEEFPDLSTQVIITETFSSEVITVADVQTEKTPYISAEAGLGYSWGLGSAFRYFGANFYLSPVNKKAPLRTFSGWNYFKKAVSFHVGVANSFGTRPANAYSLLGDASTSDLLVGIGFRTGRIVKFNLNWIPYLTNQDNPLSSDRKLRFDFAPSIGLDINLLGALGDVATVLNLKK